MSISQAILDIYKSYDPNKAIYIASENIPEVWLYKTIRNFAVGMSWGDQHEDHNFGDYSTHYTFADGTSVAIVYANKVDDLFFLQDGVVIGHTQLNWNKLQAIYN